MMNPIKLVAHRGHQQQYPENTLLSLAEAIHAGARFVETDVQLSLDKVPVLYHDNHMRRISGVKGTIHDYPFAELIRIPAYEPKRFGHKFIDQKITPLADLVSLLLAHPQVHAFVEIKRCSIQQHGIETLYQCITDLLMPVVDQCTLISFSKPFIEYASQTAWPSLGVVVEHWSDINTEVIQTIKPEYIFCDYKQLPRSGSINLTGPHLVIYEINDAQTAIQLIERGADMIETFAFTELQQELNQRFHTSP
ncbi:MAG: hypothetical protein K9K86_04770 [Pseudomonadales bacterium]|nr:hypothetical protein [Pseudomonadales bacterium]